MEKGVREYEFDRCFHDYRLSMLDCMILMVPIVISLDFTVNERAHEFLDILLKGFCAAILDLNAVELLEK